VGPTTALTVGPTVSVNTRLVVLISFVTARVVALVIADADASADADADAACTAIPWTRESTS
jgi:hypothetical protein